MKTQVGIIGAGPAGLFLAHILKQRGVESVVLEANSREHVEGRLRAGVLEPSTIDTLNHLGLGERMEREGLVDTGLDMRFRGRTIHLDLPSMAGHAVKIYGQQQVVKDLIAARVEAGDPILFEAHAEALDGLDGSTPSIRFMHGGEQKVLECTFVAGCDGFHGISRSYLPKDVLRTYACEYDFAWLGVMVHAKPIANMTYSNHDRGFALCSRRADNISRLYLQVRADDSPENWSDDHFWDELHIRMFDEDRSEIQEGEIYQRNMARVRAFIAEPMQYGRLYMAGDVTHIVPPAGAKGLNMAVADARLLARGFGDFFSNRSTRELDRYASGALDRIWRTVRFSNWLTCLLHRSYTDTPFERGMQLAELEHIARSEAAQSAIAQQYVNLSELDN